MWWSRGQQRIYLSFRLEFDYSRSTRFLFRLAYAYIQPGSIYVLVPYQRTSSTHLHAISCKSLTFNWDPRKTPHSAQVLPVRAFKVNNKVWRSYRPRHLYSRSISLPFNIVGFMRSEQYGVHTYRYVSRASQKETLMGSINMEF